MKAISTKYVGPTYTKPGRIIATDMEGHKVTLSYDDSESHYSAAQALQQKMNWPESDLIEGGIKTGSVFVGLYTKSYIKSLESAYDVGVLQAFAEAHDLPVMAQQCRTRIAELDGEVK